MTIGSAMPTSTATKSPMQSLDPSVCARAGDVIHPVRWLVKGLG